MINKIVLNGAFCEIAYRDSPKDCTALDKLGYTNYKVIEENSQKVIIIKSNKEIHIIIRGTENLKNWSRNADFIKKVKIEGIRGKVHAGFKKCAEYCEEIIIREIGNITIKKITITGHSLGAAIADILVLRLYKNYIIKDVYLFGCPRVGNKKYTKSSNKIAKEKYNRVNILNDLDIIYNAPLLILFYYSLNVNILITHDCKLIKNPSHKLIHFKRIKVLLKNKDKIQEIFQLISDHDSKNYNIMLEKIYGLHLNY